MQQASSGRPAIRTESVQFKVLRGQMKSIGRGHLLPQTFDGRVFELDDMPASSADEMIVIAFREQVIVLRFFAESSRLREPFLA